MFEELEKKGIKTGTPSLGGGITTAGDLVFIAATIDGYFRAFDARNGKELWSTKLEVPAHAIPSTYMGRDGKQYVVDHGRRRRLPAQPDVGRRRRVQVAVEGEHDDPHSIQFGGLCGSGVAALVVTSWSGPIYRAIAQAAAGRRDCRASRCAATGPRRPRWPRPRGTARAHAQGRARVGRHAQRPVAARVRRRTRSR